MKCAAAMLILSCVFIFWSRQEIVSFAEGKTWEDVGKIPFNRVGLLLGSNKYGNYGGENLFFTYRINAAVELFNGGKIKHIIVSGDNHREGYDEATDMHDALVALGVPDSCITLDYAGFRTFDSVVRAKKVFGQDSITVISQKFHNERAVYIADHFGIHAIGFNAMEVPSKYDRRTKLREYLAKAKAILDLYVLGSEPKFLGEKIRIKT